PSRYRFALGVPQSVTEQVLADRLAALGGAVRREYRAETVTPAADRYLVTGTRQLGADAARVEISARYVTGCDGAHSIVRSSAGLDFPGSSYPSQFVLADAKLRTAPGQDDEARYSPPPRALWWPGGCPAATTASSLPWMPT